MFYGKITLNTLEEFRSFCKSEKEKEKAFLKENVDCYYRAYRYFENHLNACNFNILEGLAADEEFLVFPLDIEILENPISVEQIGFFAEFFDDYKKALEYANKRYSIDGERGLVIYGRGLFYEYGRD